MPRYIDADAMIARMRKDPLFPFVEKYGLTGVIEAQPTADVVERKRGKWMTKKLLTEDLEPTSTIMYKCPFCGWEVGLHVDYDPWKFCPNCGAEMEQ